MSRESLSEHHNTSNVDHFGEGDNDLLQRRKPGEALSKLMRSYVKPRVVALNGNWGTGKTWFLERWRKHHRDRFADTIVVYFDAFEHDYISDPLPALVTALAKENPDGNIKEIKEAAFKLAQPLARKALAIAGPGTSEIVNLLGEFINALTDEKEYWNNEKERMEGMGKFRSALEVLISQENGKRLIFVVDELDRCRPDYALEVLEVIKHFFSVDNVHFILGVNLKALGDMVRVRYGSKIDAEAYLEKFIQIKLALPEEFSEGIQSQLNVLKYLNYLCQKMQIPSHIGEWLKVRAKFVCRINSISFRQIEHIVSAVALASPESRRTNGQEKGYYYDGRYAIMVDLIIARVVCPKLHPRFLDATITPEELQSYLGNLELLSGEETYQWKWAFDTWLLLSGNEDQIGRIIPGFVNEELAKRNDCIKSGNNTDRIIAIKGSFYGIYYPLDNRELRNLPKKIQREWLDLFHFHEST